MIWIESTCSLPGQNNIGTRWIDTDHILYQLKNWIIIFNSIQISILFIYITRYRKTGLINTKIYLFIAQLNRVLVVFPCIKSSFWTPKTNDRGNGDKCGTIKGKVIILVWQNAWLVWFLWCEWAYSKAVINSDSTACYTKSQWSFHLPSCLLNLHLKLILTLLPLPVDQPQTSGIVRLKLKFYFWRLLIKWFQVWCSIYHMVKTMEKW